MKTMCFSIALIFALLTQVAPPPNPGPLPAKYVADATEQITGHRAHMTNEIHLLAGTSLAGPAFTMRIVRDETASRSVEGLAAIKAMETIPEGSVVVAALDDEKDFAVFGATFAVLAKSRNLAGFVIDGSVRSLPSLQRMEFPTFARGTVPGSAGGHYRLDGLNVPIFCGGIAVKPGDVVVADADGVAVAPKERYDEVLPVAMKMQSEDQAALPLIEKYHSFTKAWQELNAAKQP
jgi:4-hydroxy-4-methyl-2-oxoglutarate aldolase